MPLNSTSTAGLVFVMSCMGQLKLSSHKTGKHRWLPGSEHLGIKSGRGGGSGSGDPTFLPADQGRRSWSSNKPWLCTGLMSRAFRWLLLSCLPQATHTKCTGTVGFQAPVQRGLSALSCSETWPCFPGNTCNQNLSRGITMCSVAGLSNSACALRDRVTGWSGKV